ncbi:MAG: hypothetical protein WC822_02810 [Candidatus Paceibacterota bacterium]|jgi:hypothetical protein
MTAKIKNIIILLIIAIALVLGYVFFFKKAPDEGNLISTSPSGDIVIDTTADTLNQNTLITKDLLSILLSIKNIKLDDSIFSDEAFISLNDSSILLTSPGDEGRQNPFAPIGFENIATPAEPVAPLAPAIP